MAKLFDELQLALKEKLKKENPGFSDKKINEMSEAIALENSNEAGRQIVAENVKVLLDSTVIKE